MVHPKLGLNKAEILKIGKDRDFSRRLSICMQDVTDGGWLCIPNLGLCFEMKEVADLDMMALLGYSDYPQEPVLEKIESFLMKLAQRAILDMHRMKQTRELSQMWFDNTTNEAVQSACNQAFTNVMIQWEELNLGWVMIGVDYKGIDPTLVLGCLHNARTVFTRFRDVQEEAACQSMDVQVQQAAPVETIVENVHSNGQNPRAQIGDAGDHSGAVPEAQPEGVTDAAERSSQCPSPHQETPTFKENGTPLSESTSQNPRQSSLPSQVPLRYDDVLCSQWKSTQDLFVEISAEGKELLLHISDPLPTFAKPGCTGFGRTPRILSLSLAPPGGASRECSSPVRRMDLNMTVSKWATAKASNVSKSITPADKLGEEGLNGEDATATTAAAEVVVESPPKRAIRGNTSSVCQQMEAVMEEIGGLGCDHCMDFVFGRDLCRQRLVEDIDPLEAFGRELSTNVMNWFRIWYSSQMKDQSVTFASPYFSKLLRGWVKSQRSESYESIVQFNRTKGGLEGRGAVLIVPINEASHWSVVVMTEAVLLHFDSVRAEKLHNSALFY